MAWYCKVDNPLHDRQNPFFSFYSFFTFTFATKCGTIKQLEKIRTREFYYNKFVGSALLSGYLRDMGWGLTCCCWLLAALVVSMDGWMDWWHTAVELYCVLSCCGMLVWCCVACALEVDCSDWRRGRSGCYAVLLIIQFPNWINNFAKQLSHTPIHKSARNIFVCSILTIRV